MDAPADRDLILRVRRGEVEAFGELAGRYQQSVFNVCYRVLQDRRDAEDLAQEALMRGYEQLDRYDIDRPFGPWIHRVAANLAINTLRGRKQEFELDEAEGQPEQTAFVHPEASLLQKERSADIQAALAQLPPVYRAAIELRHFQEMDYEQMAAALGVPLNTARSHLYRARRMLAEIIGTR